MKKIVGISIVNVICLLFPLVFADEPYIGSGSKNNRTNIYFCTRDVQEHESIAIPSSKSLDDYPDSIMVVGNHDSIKHKHIRHCFFLLAKEIANLNTSSDELVLEVSPGFSMGYYPDGNGRGDVLSEDEWLFDKEKRDERMISCTPIVKEGISKKRSCDVPVDEIGLRSAWYTLVAKMAIDVINNPYYDRNKHNCCSVAFESLRVANEESDYLFDLSDINKRSYNFLGHGISFSKFDDTYAAYALGILRLKKDAVRSITRVVVKKILPDDKVGVDNDEEL